MAKMYKADYVTKLVELSYLFRCGKRFSKVKNGYKVLPLDLSKRQDF